jgi:phenylalanyl-tRNA synthetase beta chain
MNGFGFTEAITYSFMSKAACDHLRLGSDDPGRNMLDILNPLTEDQAVMRTSVIPGLLDAMRRNISQQVRNLKLFEIGKIFISSGQDSQPDEKEMLAALWTGARVGTSWHSKDDECDFYDIKGVAESLLNALRVPNVKFTRMPPGSCTYSKPGYTAQILVNNEYVGLLGEIHPDTLRNFDLRQTGFIFELNLDGIRSLISDAKQAGPIPKYPFVPRDITLIVKKDIEAAAILEAVASIGEPLMEELYLFAVYEGDPIPKGSKSVSFRIVYRSSQETLEDEKVNDIHRRITDKLLKAFDAALPA